MGRHFETRRERRTRVLLGLAGVGVLCMLLAGGCRDVSVNSDPSPASTTTLVPQSGGKISYGIEADPNGLDPTRNALDPSGYLVASAIYDTWAAFDADGNAQPYLAEKFEHNADFTSWTITGRAGVTFHNGEPLDAESALRNIQAIQTSLIIGPAAVNIALATKVSESAVQIDMKQPWAAFPSALTGQGGFAIAPATLDDPEGSLHPIGTGPFQLENWDLGKTISLNKNKSYWRKDAGGVQLPYLANVDFQVIPDANSRIAGLKNGQLDATSASSLADTRKLDALEPGSGINVVHDPGPTESTFVMFNTAKPPFDDLRVRQAIAYATDVAALAEANGWPKDRLASGPFAPGSRWHADIGYAKYDQERAKQLVREYQADKGPIGFELQFAFEGAVAQQLVAQWAVVGITATTTEVDLRKAVITSVAGYYDAVLFRYFAAFDPDSLWPFWTKETSKPIGQVSLNFTRLEDPKIEEALASGRGSDDESTRKAAYQKVQQGFADLVPYVWLYRVDWVIASRNNVHNLRSVSLPDGTAAAPYTAGVHLLTETWIG